MTADYNGWADMPEDQREALDLAERSILDPAATPDQNIERNVPRLTVRHSVVTRRAGLGFASAEALMVLWMLLAFVALAVYVIPVLRHASAALALP